MRTTFGEGVGTEALVAIDDAARNREQIMDAVERGRLPLYMVAEVTSHPWTPTPFKVSGSVNSVSDWLAERKKEADSFNSRMRERGSAEPAGIVYRVVMMTTDRNEARKQAKEV